MKHDEKSNHKKRFGVVEFTALILIIVIVVILLLFLTGKSESYTSNTTRENSISILDCKSEKPNEKFFSHNAESTATHEIKIIFDNNAIDKLTYTYIGRYVTNTEAKDAISWMQGDYNKYMGTTSVYQEDLTPTFSVIGTEAIINLYFNTNTFNSETARFVFLDDGEYTAAKNMSAKNIEKIYREKGFSCEFNK